MNYHPGPAPPAPPSPGHRPLQLPLHLLHAEKSLRPRLPFPRPARAVDLRRDHTPHPALPSPWRRKAPPDRGRAPAAPEPRPPRPDAVRDPGHRSDPDDERRAPGPAGQDAQGCGAPADYGEPGQPGQRRLPDDE